MRWFIGLYNAISALYKHSFTKIKQQGDSIVQMYSLPYYICIIAYMSVFIWICIYICMLFTFGFYRNKSLL